jgi:metal-responsive CopG/Arc/MetJ family transcriptional regulator
MKRFSITVPEQVFEEMEKARKDVPRSRFIAKILERTLKPERAKGRFAPSQPVRVKE